MNAAATAITPPRIQATIRLTHPSLEGRDPDGPEDLRDLARSDAGRARSGAIAFLTIGALGGDGRARPWVVINMIAYEGSPLMLAYTATKWGCDLLR